MPLGIRAPPKLPTTRINTVNDLLVADTVARARLTSPGIGLKESVLPPGFKPAFADVSDYTTAVADRTKQSSVQDRTIQFSIYSR